MQELIGYVFKETVVIKADHNVLRSRIMQILALIGLFLILVSVVYLYLAPRFDKSASPPSRFVTIPFIAVVLLNALSFITNIRQGHYWKAFEQRRKLAVQGDQNLLAAEQPTPYETALPLPFSIQCRNTSFESFWLPLTIVMVSTLIIVGAIGFIIAVLKYLALWGELLFLGIIAAITFFLILLILIIVFVVRLMGAPQQVEVTEKGMTTRLRRTVHTIAWDEIRLFAIDAPYGLKKIGPGIMYQLASANDVIKWTRIQPFPKHSKIHRGYFEASEPVLTYEDYNRQMQALLALIAAKTKL